MVSFLKSVEKMTSGHLVLTLCCCIFAGVSAEFSGFAPHSCRTQTFSRTRTNREINPRFKRDVSTEGFTPCFSSLEAADLKKLKQNTHETKFLDDDGSSFILSWVGDGTGVILVLSTYNIPIDWFFEQGSSHLYRSEDSGKTFSDISHVINNTYIRKEFGINVGPGHSQRVILTADTSGDGEKRGVIFTSGDSGISFQETTLPFHPGQVISYHPSNPDYLLVTSTDKTLWLSVDFGQNWRKVHANVHSFSWGAGITLFFSTSPKGTVDADRRGELFLKRTEDLGKTFTTVSKNIFSFGYIGSFLFTSVVEKPGKPRVIYVSSNQGDSFNQAQLPSATLEQFYSVLEADAEMIFMHVDEPGDTNFGTVYTSDDSGIVFSKSLERHLFSPEGKSDFTNITSLRGVYLTNVLEKDGRIRSVISYDRGGEWRLLNKPENVKCEASVKECNLHIHGEYSRIQDLAPLIPLSDPSATGLVIAHGSVGDSIKSARPDIYISDDGGYSWMRTLKGPHHYAILDSGGLIVAVEFNIDKAIKSIKFSTDEGQCWKSYDFTQQPVTFAGLASEPGTKTMNISVWGYRTEEDSKVTWVSVTIDFEELLTRDCEDKDYVLWLAHSSNEESSDNDGCVLGYKERFRRLKKLSVCRNGRDYIVSKEETPCPCTRHDYLCDYGYYRHENSSECIEQPAFENHTLELCLNGQEELLQTSGYRKVPGDKCEGGFTPQRKEKNINKQCGAFSQASESKPETTIVTALTITIMIVALSAAVFLIVRKYVFGGRILAYRFSALQQQDDDPCITGNLNNVVSNGRGFHDDSDEDLIG
ncbi:sortilin [Lepisosteus oculatus]|uniref:sortilin n=1 Tax=Lepisosteus oculatus TaxID=7918 RepID=UPI0037122BA1